MIRCAGCRAVIPPDYMPRSFRVEQLAFCTRTCFDRHAPELLRTLFTVVRHIATAHRGKSADLASMVITDPHREVPLL